MTTQAPTEKVTWNAPSAQKLIALAAARRKQMLIGAVVGLLVALIALACATPRYTISASVMLQLGREMTPPPTLTDNLSMPAEKRPEDIATAVEMMSGQHLLEEVVNSFGEDFFYGKPEATGFVQKAKRFASNAIQSTLETASSAFSSITGKRKLTHLEKAVVALQKDLEVESARRSDVVNITLSTGDPDKGKQILTRFIELYRQTHLRAYQTPQAREFFEQEHDRLANQLRDAEQSLEQFKAQHQVYDGDDQRKLLIQQQQEIQSSYSDLQVNIARVTAELESMKKMLDGLPAEVPVQSVQQRNPLVDELRKKLADAEADLARVKAHYTDDSRVVQDASAEVDLLHKQLDAQASQPFVTETVTSGASDTRKALQGDYLKEQSELDGLRAQSAVKQQQMTEVADRQCAVDAAETELVRRYRDVQILEQSYKLYAKNLEDARINEAMDNARISNIAVIEPPTASLVQTYPPTTLWLIAGIFLGGITPLAYAFFGESLRPAFSPVKPSES